MFDYCHDPKSSFIYNLIIYQPMATPCRLLQVLKFLDSKSMIKLWYMEKSSGFTVCLMMQTIRVSSRNFILGGELTDHVAVRPRRGEDAGGGCACVECEANHLDKVQ